MTSEITIPTMSESDFIAIEAAVKETVRGRLFLEHFAKRNRHADTLVLLDAIGRIEKASLQPAPQARDTNVDVIRTDILAMADAISRTKAEIAAMRPDGSGDHFEEASVELDAIVDATEKATGDILNAAELIQETAWNLREQGANDGMCDQLDSKATDIYTACSFQDITGQRIRKVVQVLHYLEQRVSSMASIWVKDLAGDSNNAPFAPPEPFKKRGDAALLNGPARPGEGMEQNDIDMMMDDDLFDAPKDNGKRAVEPPARRPEERRAQPQKATSPEVPARQLVITPVVPPKAKPATVTPPAPPLAQEAAPPTIPAKAQATAKAALATAPVPAQPAIKTDPNWAPPIIAGMPSVEDIEKLSFLEKAALFS